MLHFLFGGCRGDDEGEDEEPSGTSSHLELSIKIRVSNKLESFLVKKRELVLEKERRVEKKELDV